MLGKMLKFLQSSELGELDYLILDLPPGTGDVAMDIHAMIPHSKELLLRRLTRQQRSMQRERCNGS